MVDHQTMPIRFQANKKKAISNFTAATNFVAAFFLLFVSRLATNVAGVAKIREFANRSGQDFRHLPREALNSGGLWRAQLHHDSANEK